MCRIFLAKEQEEKYVFVIADEFKVNWKKFKYYFVK